MSTRKPSVADKFYPGSKRELESMFTNLLNNEKGKIKSDLSEKTIIGAVVPHAGYIYSGYEATHFFEILKKSHIVYDCVFIINPNHTGYGSSISLDENEFWETPLGRIEIDKDFAELLDFDKSEKAHKFEHSGEVILPFLQHYLEYNFKILPLCILSQTFENAKIIAQKIYNTNQELKKKILIIASSDFSHFVEPEEGIKLDDMALKGIMEFNSEDVYKTIIQNNISVCGYGPIMVLLEYSKLVTDSPNIDILSRGNSGKNMPSNEVVDYISILVYQ